MISLITLSFLECPQKRCKWLLNNSLLFWVELFLTSGPHDRYVRFIRVSHHIMCVPYGNALVPRSTIAWTKMSRRRWVTVVAKDDRTLATCWERFGQETRGLIPSSPQGLTGLVLCATAIWRRVLILCLKSIYFILTFLGLYIFFIWCISPLDFYFRWSYC